MAVFGNGQLNSRSGGMGRSAREGKGKAEEEGRGGRRSRAWLCKASC